MASGVLSSSALTWPPLALQRGSVFTRGESTPILLGDSK